ncbi:hypothetical protein HCD_00725 [Helicobacter cetorum MIT 99-5656]|uniref:Uncharacterized protein n=1 Tax=Helicobacter cetorum (strain ATCC BAA-540 / CCUG 52418 / MIT 99-5656) TaxID=1163745 RepID=I0EQF8_HELCM|nr:hypothetical protein HCD_00725 [Helicobacter cetorum MIT 99-5656]
MVNTIIITATHTTITITVANTITITTALITKRIAVMMANITASITKKVVATDITDTTSNIRVARGNLFKVVSSFLILYFIFTSKCRF